MVDPASQCVRVEQRGAVLFVTIDRPEVRNAMNGPVSYAIGAAMDRLEESPELSLCILTGAGGVFSSGADLKALAQGKRYEPHPRGNFGICRRPPAKPVIAAVEGLAYGGGFEVCLACDLVVAARDARFALPEVKRNLIAAGGGVLRLPKRIGYNRAMELILTGRSVDAESLHNWGFVTRLAEPGHALEAATHLATEILENGPVAVAASTRIVRNLDTMSEEEGWTEVQLAATRLRASRDTEEGVRAYLEKRKPIWRGE